MTILREATEKVHGERGQEYGPPIHNHTCTADMMLLYLRRRYGDSMEFDALDVCAFNLLQKISRLGQTSDHRDSLVDIAGYAENWGMILDSWDEE